MRVLAIETSCDETSASIVETVPQSLIKVHSNSTATSLTQHAVTGGIIPEQAARAQIKFIIPVLVESLLRYKGADDLEADKKFVLARNILVRDIDTIAVTVGPGLIGSLLVGVETAKTLSYTLDKPIIPVNHLLGHIYANFITNDQKSTINNQITFPFIGLIVSGGHTDLLLFKSHKNFSWLGGTRDDAAGEALDKIGRILGLPYPGGPEIEKRAKLGKTRLVPLKSPMIETENFDFSFSGLKTQTMRYIQKTKNLDEQMINNICAAVQNAIIKVLVKKTFTAARQYQVGTILLGGGVSANQDLRDAFNLEAKRYKLNVHIFAPKKEYCTDNAAMIGAWAALAGKPVNWKKIHADPELYFVLK